MEPYIYEYGQLYEGLLRVCPRLDAPTPEGYVYQFLSMPMTPDWNTTGDSSVLADLSSPTRDGFYQVGARRVSQAYRDLLESLNPVVGEGLISKVENLLTMPDYGRCRVDCDQEEDMLRWAKQGVPDLEIEVDSSIPCDNAWTRLCDGRGAAGFSTLLAAPCRYTFTAEGLGIYDVRRGAWYQENLITPQFPLIGQGTLTKADFFGPGGALQHVACRMVVVWKPQVILRLSPQGMRRLQPATNALGREAQVAQALGLNFDFAQASVLPMANGLDGEEFSVSIPGASALQLWGVQSTTHYME